MKSTKNYNIAILILVLAFLQFSCSPEEESAPIKKMVDSEVPTDFNYETLKTVPTDLTFTYSDSDLPMALERFGLYADEEGEDLLFTGVTDMNGQFSQELVFPDDVENVYVKLENEPHVFPAKLGQFVLVCLG